MCPNSKLKWRQNSKTQILTTQFLTKLMTLNILNCLILVTLNLNIHCYCNPGEGNHSCNAVNLTPHWMCVLEPPLLQNIVVISTWSAYVFLETWVWFLVAALLVEQTFQAEAPPPTSFTPMSYKKNSAPNFYIFFFITSYSWFITPYPGPRAP